MNRKIRYYFLQFLRFFASSFSELLQGFGNQYEEGTNTGVEIELQPNQSATAVLSANQCILEILVGYTVSLSGQVAVNLGPRGAELSGHYFHALSVNDLLEASGLETEKNFFETIKMVVYANASLTVFDKATGVMLL